MLFCQQVLGTVIGTSCRLVTKMSKSRGIRYIRRVQSQQYCHIYCVKSCKIAVGMSETDLRKSYDFNANDAESLGTC